MTMKDEATTPTIDESTEPTPRPTGIEMMKAIVQGSYGSEPEDVLRLAEIARPTGGETDGPWLGGFDRQLRAMMLSPLVSQKLGILGAKENAADLSVLRELVESGKVTPAVDQTYPLSEAAAAIRYLQDGNARGKVVITV